MKRLVVFASLALVLVFAMSALAADLPHFKKGTGVDHGAPIGSLKADRDTVYICGPWGSGAAYNGQFEDIGGWSAAWNGWTHEDNTIDPNFVGDFATLRAYLNEIDPCRTNNTYQVTFIDDGIVVPGTGGTPGINWRYGPGGFIVTTEGGLAGPEYYIDNQITSPVMIWPEPANDGCIFAFDGYAHEDLDADAPGVFYVWGVRSTPSTNPDDIVYSDWKDRNFVYYDDPLYARRGDEVTDLMMIDRQFVQVCLGVVEYGYVWGWTGRDGYPAPYFDNVALKCYPFFGPGMAGRDLDLAQDAFPESGTIDYENLGANNCRFDMAQSISPQGDLGNDPGDSIIIQIKAVRSGSQIFGAPQIVWKLKPNHLFDGFRTSLDTEGSEGGWNVTGDNYAFDLPDSGFLFPGDILHYCIVARDQVDGSDIGTSIMPADTTGFNDFSTPLAYNLSYTVNCLPTIVEVAPGVYDHPDILFWNDAQGFGLENQWFSALNDLGLIQGEDYGGYDVYATNGPSSGAGNGLGGRAGPGSITGYTTILYGCSDLGIITISNGDFGNDPSNDVGLLDQWLQQGDKNMFLCGDDLINDMVINGGSATQQFVVDYMGLIHNSVYLRPLINNQYAPVIKPVPLNPVFVSISSWIAYGGCYNYNMFDAVTADGIGQRIAEFSDPNGQMGAYPYSAATLAVNATFNSRVITMPFGFMFLYNDPDEILHFTRLNARARVMYDVLRFFDRSLVSTDVPAGQGFSLSNSPNPFNPRTTISFTMPQAGRMTLKVYNVRGELVRTLVDEVRQAGPQKVDWDGIDDRGAAVSSGVYFFEGKMAGGPRIIKKSALVR